MVSSGTLLLIALAVYCAVGIVVGFLFVCIGVSRALDHPAPVSFGARILLFPASVALWPIVLRRWIKAPAHP